MDAERTRDARDAAETALVRVAHHYGAVPGFVVIGGLVPELLTAGGGVLHQGTTDIDVQVDVEIQAGSVNSGRLEEALRNAEFDPTEAQAWRWRTNVGGRQVEVKFELLADQDDVGNSTVMSFDGTEQLAAMNLHGTRHAAVDATERHFTRKVGDLHRTVALQVTGPVGFVLSKAAAYAGRRKDKDLYDIAFVAIHNDAGLSGEALGRRIAETFPGGLPLPVHRSLREVAAAFTGTADIGADRYATQFVIDNPAADRDTQAAIAVAVIGDVFRHATTG